MTSFEMCFYKIFFIQNLAGFFIFFCIDETYFRFWHLNINEFGPMLRCTRQSIVHHTPDDLMGRMQWCIDTPSLIRCTLHFSVSLSLPLTAIPPFPNHYFCQQSSPVTPPAPPSPWLSPTSRPPPPSWYWHRRRDITPPHRVRDTPAQQHH